MQLHAALHKPHLSVLFCRFWAKQTSGPNGYACPSSSSTSISPVLSESKSMKSVLRRTAGMHFASKAREFDVAASGIHYGKAGNAIRTSVFCIFPWSKLLIGSQISCCENMVIFLIAKVLAHSLECEWTNMQCHCKICKSGSQTFGDVDCGLA